MGHRGSPTTLQCPPISPLKYPRRPLIHTPTLARRKDLLDLYSRHALARGTAEAAAGFRGAGGRVDVLAVHVLRARAEGCAFVASGVALLEFVELELVAKVVHEAHCLRLRVCDLAMVGTVCFVGFAY